MNSISDAPKFQPRAEGSLDRAARRAGRRVKALHKKRQSAIQAYHHRAAIDEALTPLALLGYALHRSGSPDYSEVAELIVGVATAWVDWPERPSHERIRKLKLEPTQRAGRELFHSACKRARSRVSREENIQVTFREMKGARSAFCEISESDGRERNARPLEIGILTFFRMLSEWLDRPLLARPSRAAKPKVPVAGSSSKATITTTESTPDANDTITSAHPRAMQRENRAQITAMTRTAADQPEPKLNDFMEFIFERILIRKSPMTAADAHAAFQEHVKTHPVRRRAPSSVKEDMCAWTRAGYLRPAERKGYCVIRLPNSLRRKCGKLFKKRPEDWVPH